MINFLMCVAVAVAQAAAAPPAKKSSPWLLVPVVSSNPKLGTAFGGMGAYLHKFDPESQVSLFGAMYQYTTTDSSIAGAFARTSWGADHHRIVALAIFGYIKNDYEDYLGTGQPLMTNDDMHAFATRYLYRVAGDWFIGAQGSAANYQVLGESAQDDLVLETLGIRGFESAALGAVAMHRRSRRKSGWRSTHAGAPRCSAAWRGCTARAAPRRPDRTSTRCGGRAFTSS